MKRSEAFPSRFLSKDDVEVPRQGTVDRLKRETLKSDEGDEIKTVLYFREETLKPMILNNVNWMTCEDAYGSDSDMWLGKKIELYHDQNVMFGAKRVGGVRVRIPSATPTAPEMPEAWTIERAKVELEKNGLTVDTLKAALKANGRVNAEGAPVYAAAVDTALVRQIISDALAAPEAAL